MSEELKKQVGGDHYKKHPVQPMAFNVINNVPWAEGEVIKYVVRWRDKGGVQDLEKAHHILGFLIEFHRGRMDVPFLTEAIERVMTHAPQRESASDFGLQTAVEYAIKGNACTLCGEKAAWAVGGVDLCVQHESLRISNRAEFVQLLIKAKVEDA